MPDLGSWCTLEYFSQRDGSVEKNAQVEKQLYGDVGCTFS